MEIAKDIFMAQKNIEFRNTERKSYIGYILYISLFKYFNLNLSYVVFSQIFFTFLSSLCVYKISENLSSRLGGILSISLYLFYFPLQVWNFYILTETLFICSVIFIVFFLIFFQKKYIPIIFFLIIFIILIRPHGIILVPSFFLSIIIWLYVNNNMKFFCIIILIFFFTYPTILLLNLFLADQKYSRINLRWNLWGYEDESNNLKYVISNDI